MKEKVKRNVTIVPYCIGYHFTGKHDDGNIGEIIKKLIFHIILHQCIICIVKTSSPHTHKNILFVTYLENLS